MTTDTGKTALRELRDRVAEGTFVMDAMPWPHEVTAYSAFSGSLDAVKALHEALLPEWKWYVDYDGEVGLWHKTGTDAGNVCVDDICVDGSEIHPARAWLLAILDALIQEATDDR